MQCGTNIRISDIPIYSNNSDKYIHLQKYLLIFPRANEFGYSFVIFLSCRIYSYIHYLYYHSLSMVMNIFGYSFVQKNDIRPTLMQCTVLYSLVACRVQPLPPPTVYSQSPSCSQPKWQQKTGKRNSRASFSWGLKREEEDQKNI